MQQMFPGSDEITNGEGFKIVVKLLWRCSWIGEWSGGIGDIIITQGSESWQVFQVGFDGRFRASQSFGVRHDGLETINVELEPNKKKVGVDIPM